MNFSTFGYNAFPVCWIVQCGVFTTDAISGHIILWGEGFHDRDIRPGNMMHHYNGNNVVGVLNYRGLAAVITASGAPPYGPSWGQPRRHQSLRAPCAKYLVLPTSGQVVAQTPRGYLVTTDRNPQDQKDMALFKALLLKFREVRAE